MASLAFRCGPTSRLCDVCRDIDFEHHKYHEVARKIKLGAWRKIVQEQFCPFCRLVVRALTSNPAHVTRDPNETILLTSHLSWELAVEISPYDQLKSESYSNKFDLRSVSKRCKRLPQRLIVSSEGGNVAYIQYLAPEGGQRRDHQFLGRRLDRDKVKISLLKSWMRRCEDYHHKICEEDGIAGRRLPSNLRLIDVEKRTLIKAPAGDDLCYLTLSYVWGADLMKQNGVCPAVLKRENLREDEAGEECTPLPDNLPKTIADAIWLTRELGYPYLWVDALCIVQDDPTEDKMLHLQRMDAVYNCSRLTIVAGSGWHADSGLPGISVPRTRLQHVERVRDMEMASMSPSFSELENSRSIVWNTRGWTFQEKILAKRILLFTDYQVYFRCSESIWTEEIFAETEEPSKSIEARVAKYRWTADRQSHIPSKKIYFVKMFIPQLNIDDEWNYLGKFPDYAAAIREYSQRNLSDRRDTLIAIDGVLRTLRMDAGRFVAGLPEAHLLQSLLWHADSGSLQSRVDWHLPSWTWASWSLERGLTFDVLDVRVLRIVIITIRNIFIGCGRVLSDMGSSSGSSTSDTSSSMDSSYTPSPSSSSSSSGFPIAPPLAPYPKREWKTLNAVGKATVNVALCFGLPLMFQHHTVRSAYLYEHGKASRLACEKPLSFATFTKDEMKFDDGDGSKDRDKADRYHSRKAATARDPVLSLNAVIVKFSIGKCLTKISKDENEVGMFELLDDGLCVGEVWTTIKHARRGIAEFLTISWGLSLQIAEIHDSWVPKWTFDAAILPTSKTNMLLKMCNLAQEFLSWNSGKHLAGHYGLRKAEEQPSVTQFFHALLQAKKGEARPKFLWSTVNLLMIEGGDATTRVGVGRVIFESWLLQSSSPQDIILA